MPKKEMFANMIRLARRSPLANMDEAEAVSKVIQEFAKYAQDVLDREEGDADKPEL